MQTTGGNWHKYYIKYTKKLLINYFIYASTNVPSSPLLILTWECQAHTAVEHIHITSLTFVYNLKSRISDKSCLSFYSLNVCKKFDGVYGVITLLLYLIKTYISLRNEKSYSKTVNVIFLHKLPITVQGRCTLNSLNHSVTLESL